MREINLSQEQREILTKADMILETLYAVFGKDEILTSTTTSEVIEMREIPRVCGILSGLCDNTEWEEGDKGRLY